MRLKALVYGRYVGYPVPNSRAWRHDGDDCCRGCCCWLHNCPHTEAWLPRRACGVDRILVVSNASPVSRSKIWRHTIAASYCRSIGAIKNSMKSSDDCEWSSNYCKYEWMWLNTAEYDWIWLNTNAYMNLYKSMLFKLRKYESMWNNDNQCEAIQVNENVAMKVRLIISMMMNINPASSHWCRISAPRRCRWIAFGTLWSLPPTYSPQIPMQIPMSM